MRRRGAVSSATRDGRYAHAGTAFADRLRAALTLRLPGGILWCSPSRDFMGSGDFMDIAAIRLLVLDVDGVLTDGRLTFTEDGERTKTFHVRDGCAIRLWRRCGGQVAILSGRRVPVVSARAEELGIELVRLGVSDKGDAFVSLVGDAGCDVRETAYVGDDAPDLAPMRRCGLAVAVADAAPVVKRAADLITRRGGGAGAVAEVVEYVLRAQGRWPRDALSPV